MKITNISGIPQYLTEKDGKVKEIPVEGSEEVNIDRDNVNVVAKENARLIEVEGGATKASRRSSASIEPPAA